MTAIRFRRLVVWTAAITVFLFAGAFATWQLSRSRTFQLFGKLVSRVETSEMVVALTFDDGPSTAYTQSVLDLLAERSVAATFFLTGQEISRNPEQARAIMAAGHEIGNHSWSHPHLSFAAPDKVASEIERTDASIRDLGYQADILFRPPYGSKLVTLPLYLARHDRTTVMWDVEPESYPAVASDPETLASYVVEKTRPGSIVILHVMYESRATSRAALPSIIDGLRQRGFRIVTVSELIESGEAED